MPSKNRAILDPNYNGYRIFCGDLSTRCTKEDLEKEADYYGPTSDVWIARGRNQDYSGRNPLFGFVVFKHSEDAERAVDDLHGREVCGRRIRVEHAFPYDPHRRRGGGRGGGGGGPRGGPYGGRAPPRYEGYDDRDRSRRRSRSRSYDRRDNRDEYERRRRSRSSSDHERSRSRSRDRKEEDRRKDRDQRSRSRSNDRERD